MEIKSFKCNELSQYVDSMLFDSGEQIAEMVFEDNGKEIYISLEVRGDVKVFFNEQTYRYPSEFPEELKEIIKGHPILWDCEDDIFVDMNNWFEYIFEVDGKYSDVIMCEWDISKGTSEDIKREMLEICEYILKE